MTYLDLDADEAEFNEFLATHNEEEEEKLEPKARVNIISPIYWDYVFIHGERRETDWMVDAACRGMGPELFFPERGDDGLTTVNAKKVCAGCPVQQQCLDYAVRYGEDHGVWGGQSNRGFRSLRRASKTGDLV